MALTDAPGNLIDVRLLPGQAHDLRGTAALIEGLSCRQLPADRAFDANRVREALAEAGIEAVIPPKSNRRFPAEFDRDTYGCVSKVVEILFCRPPSGLICV
jgi:transposase